MRGTRKVCPFTTYGVLRLTTFSYLDRYKNRVPEAHFHADSVNASCVIVACIAAELFAFKNLSTQRERTIVNARDV